MLDKEIIKEKYLMQSNLELDSVSNWIKIKSLDNTKIILKLLDFIFSKNSNKYIWKELRNDILKRFIWECHLNNLIIDWNSIVGLNELKLKYYNKIPDWYEDIYEDDSIIQAWNKIIYESLYLQYPNLDIKLLDISDNNYIEIFCNLFNIVEILEFNLPKFLKKSLIGFYDIYKDFSKEEYSKILKTPIRELKEEYIGVIWNLTIEKLKRIISWKKVNIFIDTQNWDFINEYIFYKL